MYENKQTLFCECGTKANQNQFVMKKKNCPNYEKKKYMIPLNIAKLWTINAKKINLKLKLEPKIKKSVSSLYKKKTLGGGEYCEKQK